MWQRLFDLRLMPGAADPLFLAKELDNSVQTGGFSLAKPKQYFTSSIDTYTQSHPCDRPMTTARRITASAQIAQRPTAPARNSPQLIKMESLEKGSSDIGVHLSIALSTIGHATDFNGQCNTCAGRSAVDKNSSESYPV